MSKLRPYGVEYVTRSNKRLHRTKTAIKNLLGEPGVRLKHMNDIQWIGHFYQERSFELLPESFDRLLSCRYFCDQIRENATIKKDQMAIWYFRAALSAYQSIIDNINGDVKNIFGKNLWCGSSEKQEMFQDPLVKLLSKARNFAVHSSRISAEGREHQVSVIDGCGSREEIFRSLFFDEIDKKTNFKDVSNVSQEQISWFNKQSKKWSVDLLISHGLYKASNHVHKFYAYREFENIKPI